MDEDLKIVLTSELEADEEASAKRISAQLPSIARLINSKGSIKIGVELATQNTQAMQSQLQKMSSRISNATNVDVGVRLHVTKDAKQMLQNALKNIGDGGVDNKIMSAMTKNLDDMQVKVKNISAEWVKFGKTKERLLQLSISGTTQDQQDITVLQQYDKSGQKVLETTKNLSLNLEKIEAQERAITERARKDNESREQYLNRQLRAVGDIHAKYSDINSNLAITDFDDFVDVETKYQNIISTIEQYKQLNGTLSAQQKIDLENEIGLLKNLRDSYINLERAEKQASDSERKDNESRVSYLNQQQILLDKINSKYTDPNASKPIVYEQDLDKIHAKYDEIAKKIRELGDVQGKISAQAKDDLASQIAGFEQLAKQLQNAEYVATSLRTKTVVEVNAEQVDNLAKYENKLRSSGTLTETFKNRIAELQRQLSGAFDSQTLTDYLNQFDRLKNEVGVFNSQLSGVNTGFKEMAGHEKTIASIKKQMLNAAPGSAEYSGLQAQLDNQVKKQKEISAEIGKQIARNPELIRYASEYNQLLFVRKDCEAQLAAAEGRMADAAKAVEENMRSIPAVVQNIETRFSSLQNAPVELSDRVKSLGELMKKVSDAKSDQEKIDAYDKLNDAIKGCNQEITQLIGVQNGDIRNFRFTEGLEKAKADLATVERQWSALKRDEGLNKQLQILKQHLNDVQDPVALKKWTIEFGRFKSEVKAAGRNVQTLEDVLKNNINKVTQWAAATASLYRVLGLIKTATTTVIDLDTAMIDLRKTTDETDATYRKFYLSSTQTAKNLGVTTKAVIAQTAEWSRLGYALSDSAKMAENSAIFTAISPELSMEESTDGLISIMKAFGYEANDVLDGIISKINKLGKRIAQQYSNVLIENSYIG